MARRMEVEGTVNFVLYAGYTLIATLLFGLITGELHVKDFYVLNLTCFLRLS